MQKNGYYMYIMITSGYRLGCCCVDLSYYTVLPCPLLLQGNVNFFCVKGCKKSVERGLVCKRCLWKLIHVCSKW